jgi:hypothetical protein
MKRLDIFDISIKLIGIVLLTSEVIRIPENFMNFNYLFVYGEFGEINNSGSQFLFYSFLALYLLFYFGLMFILIFKTAIVIKLLRLNRLENDALVVQTEKITKSDLLSIGIILIGIFLFASNIGYLIYEIIIIFRNSNFEPNELSDDIYFGPQGIMYSKNIYLLIYILFCLIGFLLFGYSKQIANFLLKEDFKNS